MVSGIVTGSSGHQLKKKKQVNLSLERLDCRRTNTTYMDKIEYYPEDAGPPLDRLSLTWVISLLTKFKRS